MSDYKIKNRLVVTGTEAIVNGSQVTTVDNAQTLTNKSISGSTNAITNIPNSALSSGVDASKIANGTVSNTEFQYLDGVTSAVQTQIDNKADLVSGKVPLSQLPSAIFIYKGVYNATTNTPTLSDATSTPGFLYRVTVAGTQDFGSGSISFSVGDYVIANDQFKWEKSDTTDAVATVNGQVGNVVLSTTDIAEGTNLYFTNARAQSAIASVGYLKADGTVSLTANLNANSNKITNVTNPTSAQDVATKNYVDVAVSGLGTGTVTNVSSANTDISIATGSTTPVLTLNSGTGASQIVKRDASSQIDAATQKIINVLDPVALQDAATKNYVDIANALKANVTLNNLGSTAINADLLAAADVTTNLGSASKYFLSGYVKNIVTNGNINPDAINTSTPRDIGNTFAFGRIRATRFSPDVTTYTFSGDFTLGSANITNVVGSIPAWFGSAYSVHAPGYTSQSGTYSTPTFVTSFSGSTIIMNTNSLLSGTGITFTAVPNLNARTEDQTTVHSGIALLRSGNTTTIASGNSLVTTGSTTTARSGDNLLVTGNSTSGGTTGNVILSPGTTSGTRGTVISTTSLSLSSNKITSLADPTTAQDAATKNYVDVNKVAIVTGDIVPTTFSIANNQASVANITGLTFANAVTRSFRVLLDIQIVATSNLYEVYEIIGVQKGSSWDISLVSTGDDSLLVFSITTAGQLQYTSPSYAGFTSGTLKFRATTIPVV